MYRFWNDAVWNFGLLSATTEIVDTTKWDIINGEKVPRKDYNERLLKQKEDELKALDEYYEKRKKEIKEERKRLGG